jgi:hypothetical protein
MLPLSDSCSSTLGFRRRGERHATESSAALPTTTTVTILPTTQTTSDIMTEAPEVTVTDKTSLKDRYDHISDCDLDMQEVFCFNGGTCYVHQYRDARLLQCECPSHFTGERCQEKALEGSYGGGMVESRIQRSEESSNTEPRRVSRMFKFLSCFSVCLAVISVPTICCAI